MALRRFFRASLARRLFGWFGVTILTTGILVSISMVLLSFLLPPRWQKNFKNWEEFTSQRFAYLWDKPQEMKQLMSHISQSFDLQIEVSDAHGAPLMVEGGACPDRSWRVKMPVERDAEVVGFVVMCAATAPTGGLVRFVVALTVLLTVLWIIALFVARRLARPLSELAGVAEALGDGELGARAEQALVYGGEVATLAESLHEMADRIARQLRDQRALLAGVSHEMRTPLGHLRLIIEILRAEDVNAARLDDLEREVVEMDDLVDRLLATSRLDFEMQHTRVVDMTSVALEALERTGTDPEKLEVRHGGGEVRGDLALIRRALANLITNAVRHGGGVKRLLIEHPEPGWIGLYVEDAGPGLPDAQLQRLFEPFVTYSSPELSGSLGLGLYLVRRIALAHDGRVDAGAVPGGQGARVGLVLPIAADPEPIDPNPQA